MIKEALEYLVKLGTAEIQDIGNETYSDKPLFKIKEPLVEPISTRSLSAIVEYLKSKFDVKTRGMVMVHIESPTAISIFEEVNVNGSRSTFMKSSAMVPEFNFSNWYDSEAFNIKLQSCFVANKDKDIMLKVVGNIKEDQVKTVGDDGVSQAVTAKIGVASVGNVQVPNPVKLRPFRTFVEIEQPESDFIFRMKNGPLCALFEADGGAWKLEAMENIKVYLEDQLEDEIKKEIVVIIA